MAIACFHADGRLAYIASGDLHRTSGDVDTILFEVPDGTNPNDVFWDADEDTVKIRREVTLNAPRTTLAYDRGESTIVRGDGLHTATVNGEEVEVIEEGVLLAPREAGDLSVLPCGLSRGTAFTVHVATGAALLDDVRKQRDHLLTACDWTQMPDVLEERGQAFQQAWGAYRSALRRLPADQPQATVDTVVWPTPPEN